MKKTVIALGFFDGLHLGHAELIKRTKERAADSGAEPAVLTFDTHPDIFVLHRDVPLLTSGEERAEMIRRLFGVENVMFVHFSEEVMRMDWRSFLDSLRTELGAQHLVVGHDFRFGYRGEGTAEKLAGYCGGHGMGSDIIPPVKVDGVTVSSTRIRALVSEGDMAGAERLLGHPHELSDIVRSGYKLGRRMGTPTINMHIPEHVIVPRYGVYATRVFFDGEEHTAVTNVGVRPTFANGNTASVESYILDYSGNLYGKRVRVEFYTFIRPERRFDCPEALRAQILTDECAVREYFKSR